VHRQIQVCICDLRRWSNRLWSYKGWWEWRRILNVGRRRRGRGRSSGVSNKVGLAELSFCDSDGSFDAIKDCNCRTRSLQHCAVGASGRRDRESSRISWDRSVSVDRIHSRAGYRGMALTTVCAEVGVCSAYHQRSASLSRLIQRSGGFADWITGINAVQSLVLVGCVNHSRVVEGTNM